jgi:hypothetical protein
LVSMLDNDVFPEEALEEMSIECILVSPVDDRIGVAAVSSKLEDKHLLRLFQMKKDEEQDYIPTHEMEAFTFQSRKDLKDFVERLPGMSALEILMAMNPQSISH